jgi:predicted aspartyl protease
MGSKYEHHRAPNVPAPLNAIATDRIKLTFVEISLAKRLVNALIDTGSALSLVSKKVVNDLPPKAIRSVKLDPLLCVTANGTTMPVEKAVSLDIKIGNWHWKQVFYVCPVLQVDVIIGRDFQHHTDMIIDSKLGCIYFSFSPQRFPFVTESRCTRISHCLSNSPSPDFQALINEFSDVVTEKLGRTNLLEYQLVTTDDKPVRLPPFGMSPPQLSKMQSIIDKHLQQGIIRKSNSPYSSPAFLVGRSNSDKTRLVVDYRRLNEKVIVENFPMPTIESCFQHLQDARYFTLLDLNSAFHQVPLDEPSRRKTAFSSPRGQYEFNYLPFGLSVSSSVFCRLVDTILGDIKYKYVFPYVDDLCIYSNTIEEHWAHVREVLLRLREAKLTINPLKISIAQKSVKFLGFIISDKGLSTDPQKVADILKIKAPRNVAALSRYMGMVGFYSRFIPNFSTISSPLNRLRRKSVEFVWSDVEQRAFDQLRQALSSPPLLHFPDFKKPFTLAVDACKAGLGAVLQQESSNGKLAPIGYASRSLSPAEANYSPYELECLGAVFGVEKFHSYLESREFLLETDNAALSWLLSSPQRPDKLARWVLRLSRYKFRLKHVKGEDNVVADCLSRLFSDQPECDSHQEMVFTQALFQFPTLLNSIADEQDADVQLAAIKRDLRNNTPRENYSLSGNTLMFKPGPRETRKVVVPSDLKAPLLKFFHDSPLAGHLGQFKTFNKIKKDYFWSRMRRDVFGYVRTCAKCQAAKPQNTGPVGLMSSTPATHCNQKLFIDYFGPLPSSSGRDVHILVIVDAFSKWVEMFPVNRISASKTNDLLIAEIFLRYGPPKFLVSDNASIFRSQKFKEMCLSWGIQHIKTTPYHPQANMVERVNRNLKYALSIYVEHDHKTWDLFVPYLRYAFNSSIHETTMNSPGKLFLAQELSDPLRNNWKIDALLHGDPGQIDDQTAQEVKEPAAAATRLARQRMAKQYNEGRRQHQFRVGQVVVVKIHPQSNAGTNTTSKFTPNWSKPMRIVRITSPVNLECEEVDSGRIKKVHVSQCKYYHVRN